MISKSLGSIGKKGALACAVLLVPACAPLQLPYKSGGPAVSHEGVAIAVARQSCVQNEDPDFYGNDLVEEVVEVQVRNPTAMPLRVQRDAFRLVSPDGSELSTVTSGAADPLALGAGETRTFELRYLTRGAVACTRPMKLDPDAGVRLDGHPVQVGAVSFQPARAL